MNIGTLVPIARRRSKPPAFPGYSRFPTVLNVKALRPKPAKTIPLALALVASGNDLAMALTEADRPAAPPQPDRNIAKHSKNRPNIEGGPAGSVEARMGMVEVKKRCTTK